MNWLVLVLIMVVPLFLVGVLYLQLRLIEKINAELPEESRFELIGWYGPLEKLRFLREVEAYWRRHRKK